MIKAVGKVNDRTGPDGCVGARFYVAVTSLCDSTTRMPRKGGGGAGEPPLPTWQVLKGWGTRLAESGSRGTRDVTEPVGGVTTQISIG